MKNNLRLLFIELNPAFVVALSIIVVVFLFSYLAPSSSKRPLIIHTIEPLYAADFSDDRILVGGSQNVFTGKIVKQLGTQDGVWGPETQFQVEVIDNIKGELTGLITLDQQGGYRDGELYVVGDEDTQNQSILQPGSTYIFATRYSSVYNWYTLNSYPAALELISNNPEANNAELLSLINSNKRYKELKSAYPNEILLKADIDHNNISNSYASIKEPVVEDRDEGGVENNEVTASSTDQTSEASTTTDEMNTSATSTDAESP